MTRSWEVQAVSYTHLAPDNNNWLPGTDYYVYGLSEGTVTATGTPVDKTNNVEPVVLTIKVEASEQEAPDLTALTNKGLEGFLSYAEKNVNQNYDINGAWNLYTLASCLLYTSRCV